jgi:hypothetical protein
MALTPLISEEKMKLDELDRILKWEFLGAEDAQFNWASVAWGEVGETVSSVMDVFCRAEEYA